jgi:hypothetical protein
MERTLTPSTIGAAVSAAETLDELLLLPTSDAARPDAAEEGLDLDEAIFPVRLPRRDGATDVKREAEP